MKEKTWYRVTVETAHKYSWFNRLLGEKIYCIEKDPLYEGDRVYFFRYDGDTFLENPWKNNHLQCHINNCIGLEEINCHYQCKLA
jgi:hypothetical protein